MQVTYKLRFLAQALLLLQMYSESASGAVTLSTTSTSINIMCRSMSWPV